ncbi:aldose epimerase family protein [Levilactobacillus bambusae]|uniref:Galactose mutarotase n=1 Tax=Levilactobacillus bambusae TaxID=2024736 RepID=A0A2V1N151_9LACO|nr:aldose epimerase family protein [Levilactobacillus bambusae]PWG00115.1 galactose mutarotase [Levilactobacillus bambusae]
MKTTQSTYRNAHGETCTRYVLTNDKGTSIIILSYGATFQSFIVTEGDEQHDLLVSEPNPDVYTDNVWNLSKAVGPVAGRISNAAFTIGQTPYQLEANEGQNLLHGGPHGFAFVNWDGTVEESTDQVSVTLTHRFTEEDDGFPGPLEATITYELTNDNRVNVNLTGHSDMDTLFNPTIHVYWNVTDSGYTINNQWLKINGDQRVVTNAEKIPTGEIVSVADTAYDFREGPDMKTALDALSAETGGIEFDDAYEVSPSSQVPVAQVGDNDGHRQVSIYSDRNGLVIFTANPQSTARQNLHDYDALATEAQTLPDAINHDGFGNIVLPKNETVTHTISYQYERL